MIPLIRITIVGAVVAQVNAALLSWHDDAWLWPYGYVRQVMLASLILNLKDLGVWAEVAAIVRLLRQWRSWQQLRSIIL
jgi:hypothetical protein